MVSIFDNASQTMAPRSYHPLGYLPYNVPSPSGYTIDRTGAADEAIGTRDWLFHSRAMNTGHLTAGGSPAMFGVPGETRGETAIFGLGQMLGMATEQQRQ